MKERTKMNVTSEYALSQPGDGTRYEFLITDINTEYIYISELSGLSLSYGFRIDTLIDFSNNFLIIKQKISKDTYKTVIINSGMFDFYFVNYAIEKLNCNPWTAIAAFQCVFQSDIFIHQLLKYCAKSGC